ncbi:hypothetical protein [Streptomyces sp. NPDC056707]|uniref:hypothetical protein n=1 Tax=Streptomyces sp. NPDC056707 TaxID=3345919 RepID=UPI00369B0994
MSQDLAVHHAGVAAEHVLKAYLARLHPALIVEGKDFNSLLYATGHGAYASVPESQTKTIGLVDAYVRVVAILKGKMPVTRKELQPLADARNGVAHAGFHDPAQVNAVFTTCLRLMDPLLPWLTGVDSFWGPYRGLHDKLLDQRVEAARVQLEGKLTKARHVFSERYAHFAEKDRELVLAAIANVASPGYIEHDEGADCPACSSQGWLGGETHISEDEDTVVMTPSVFDCPACDLHLEMEELDMLAEPLGGDIDLEVSPMDFYVHFEPDETYAPTEDDQPDEDQMVDAYRNR